MASNKQPFITQGASQTDVQTWTVSVCDLFAARESNLTHRRKICEKYEEYLIDKVIKQFVEVQEICHSDLIVPAAVFPVIVVVVVVVIVVVAAIVIVVVVVIVVAVVDVVVVNYIVVIVFVVVPAAVFPVVEFVVVAVVVFVEIAQKICFLPSFWIKEDINS